MYDRASGMTATIGLYPLETLRTRLAMGDYDSLFQAVKVITAEEGFMAFYQVNLHRNTVIILMITLNTPCS